MTAKDIQASIINKDFEHIAYKLNQVLAQHLDDTDGYIGEFPGSKRYYATVAETDDYYFDYFRWCMFDRNTLPYALKRLNALVDRDRFQTSATKGAAALAGSVICIALMWFCKGWFFTYEGLSLVKIGALTLVFIALLALIWWSSHDPDEFASQLSMEDSPAGYFTIGLLAAVLVRIFLSGTTASLVCCAAAGMSGLCFLTRMLSAQKRLRMIEKRSPLFQKLSLSDREYFELHAQKIHRFVRFLELWYERESTKENKQHMEYVRQSLMECVEEYDQWCSEYLKDETAL